MASQDEISRFIRSSFRSVWSLELLLLLKRDPRPWSQSEILAALRASDLIVSQSVAALTAAGLLDIDAEGRVSYLPVTEQDRLLVEEAEAFYARRPDAVRRLIIGASSGLAAFADAFRLRKD